MMKKVTVSMAISFLLYASWAFGSPIPDLSVLDGSDIPPPILGQFPVQQDEEVPEDDGETKLPPASLEEAVAASRHLSGVAYLSLLDDWGIKLDEPTIYEESSAVSEVDGPLVEQVVFNEANASDDLYQDVEPSVIVMNRGGIYHTVTAYFSYQPEPLNDDRRIFFSTSTAYPSFTTKGQIPIPGEYIRSGDPLLDQNPYTSGIGPQMMYLTGIVFNAHPFGGPWGVPNGIGIWRSDNGGLSWSQPYVIRNDSPIRFLDKPDIAVSLHPGSLGYVYVAYLRATFGDLNKTRLFVARSTDGGVTFASPVPVKTGKLFGQQILVNPFYGYIYVLWADYANNKILMSTSLDYGQTWSAPEEAATGEMVPNIDFPIYQVRRAPTVCMARFNWVANRICVVWHEYDSIPGGGQDTNIYYTSKAPGGQWQAKVRVNDDTGGSEHFRDQFMPALDFDRSGNLLVTFYDRRNDYFELSNLYYNLYTARITPTGGGLASNANVSSAPPNPLWYQNKFIGDYHDVWSETETTYDIDLYLPSWVRIREVGGQGYVGDIYVSVIQP